MQRRIKEYWLPIKDFDAYEVSNMGKVRSKERTIIVRGVERLLVSRELAQNTCKRGFKNVGLSVQGTLFTRRVHRLVAEQFLPRKKDKNKVVHLSGDRNDNRYTNLRWCSAIGKDYYVA